MKSIIDIHSHVLPCVDDGCKSKEEALKMLKMYERQGAEAIICTPHYGPCGFTGADVNGTFEWLSTQSNVKLYIGNEILFDGSTIDDVKTGKARHLAGSDRILVEFEEWWYSTTPYDMLNGLKSLIGEGFKPILAHPERYRGLVDSPEYFGKIHDIGVEFQINCYDICESYNFLTSYTTQYLLQNKMVSYIGSDAHGAIRRPPALAKGVKWIYDNCPTEYADAIVHDNAKKIIGGE